MDFSFHIQNFSAIAYHKTVKPGQEATVAYSFIPADAFAGRAIGLTINLNYRDSEGNFYFDPVFNETVQVRNCMTFLYMRLNLQQLVQNITSKFPIEL